MAVAMIDRFVPAISFRLARLGWYGLLLTGLILEVESAPGAPPLLSLQQLCPLIVDHRVLLEPFRPVEEISIIGAGISPHFDILLTMRLRMVSDIDRYGGSRLILAHIPNMVCVLSRYAVFLACPCFALVGVSYIAPSGELSQGVIIAPAKHLGTHRPLVVAPPPCYDRVQFVR